MAGAQTTTGKKRLAIRGAVALADGKPSDANGPALSKRQRVEWAQTTHFEPRYSGDGELAFKVILRGHQGQRWQIRSSSWMATR
jgi:hypothetical protein